MSPASQAEDRFVVPPILTCPLNDPVVTPDNAPPKTKSFACIFINPPELFLNESNPEFCTYSNHPSRPVDLNLSDMVPVDEPLPIDIVGFATLVEPTIRLAPVVAVSVSDLIKDAACNESRVSAFPAEVA